MPISLFESETKCRVELKHVLDRDIELLSGGELQRFAIGLVCVQQADVSVIPSPKNCSYKHD